MNKGSYILFIEIPQDFRASYAKREYCFRHGIYAYVGSAMKNLKQRVNRHLMYKDGYYRKHWHIDTLLEEGKVIASFVIPDSRRREEEISRLLSRMLPSIPGFGATDCQYVDSNLFFLNNSLDDYFSVVRKVLDDYSKVERKDNFA